MCMPSARGLCVDSTSLIRVRICTCMYVRMSCIHVYAALRGQHQPHSCAYICVCVCTYVMYVHDCEQREETKSMFVSQTHILSLTLSHTNITSCRICHTVLTIAWLSPSHDTHTHTDTDTGTHTHHHVA